MSHYRDSSGNTWTNRIGIAVDYAGSGPGDLDATFTLPSSHETLWTRTQSDGDDLRVTGADGTTIKAYKFDTAFNSSNRAGSIIIDDGNLPSNATMLVMWLYFGNSTVSAGSSAFATAGTPATGYSLVSSQAPTYVFEWAREAYGRTSAADVVQKTPTEEITIALRYRPVLAKRAVPYAGFNFAEEPASFTILVNDSADAAQTGMIEQMSTRFDNEFVYFKVKSGTSGQAYTAFCTMVTTTPDGGMDRTLVRAITVNVRLPST